MAITYTSTDGLFTRLGRMMAFVKQVRQERTGIRTNYDSTMAAFTTNASRDLTPSMTQGIRRYEEYLQPVVSAISSDMNLTLLEMIDAETKMESYSIEKALLNLTRSMLADSKTIAITNTSSTKGYVTVPGSGTTLGRGTAGSSNTGNGVFIVTAMSPVRHLTNATVFDMPSVKTETIRTTVVTDSNTRNILERQELYHVEGERRVNSFSEEWPKGSGINSFGRSVTATQDHGSIEGQNVCANSDFEEFESNTPVRWTVAAGTPGTHIESVADPYVGTNALKFSGDGSTTPRITQALDDQTASAGRIHPDCAYTISAAVKTNGTAANAALLISLRDSSNTVLNDEVAGRNCELSVASSTSTSYAIFTKTIFTPKNISSGVYVDIRFDGNMDNNSEVFVDQVAIAKMYQHYPGSIYYQMISGSTPFRNHDEFTTAVTNRIVVGSTSGGTSSDGELALEFERFYNLGARGLVLPSSTSANIADSVIDYTLP
jgi:hypothetical protein